MFMVLGAHGIYIQKLYYIQFYIFFATFIDPIVDNQLFRTFWKSQRLDPFGSCRFARDAPGKMPSLAPPQKKTDADSSSKTCH